MNREILFRGKRIDNGEWVFGFYVCIGDKHHYIFEGKKDTSGLYPTFLYYEVDPSTVGQYTGLTDKNGKRIFEGDVVQYYPNGVMVVAWYAEVASYVAAFSTDFNFCQRLGRAHLYLEVIGNIHDNPELVKGEPT